jgi:8-oxo-dGTP diphosphatase
MYPNTFYRVSVKALIRNEKGEVFVVKEDGDFWGLPGGGLDHGELPRDAIKREMMEELNVATLEVGEIVYSKPIYLDRIDTWMLWVVYEATLNETEFTFGDGVTDAKYISVEELEGLDGIFEKAIVEVAKNVRK